MPRRCTLLAVIAVAFILPAPAGFGGDRQPAEAWPQFRGPDAQGHVFCNIPTSWNDKDSKVWEAAIPGKGWSSPVVADGKVWLTTAVPTTEGGLTFRALAVDQKSGKLVHDVELFAVAKPVTLHARNSPATPSPIISKGRLFAQFGSAGAVCVDTATARIVWKNTDLKVDYETGPASSPVIYKDRLIFPCDGGDFQFAVALSTATGEILWKTDRTHAAKKAPSERRAFSSPLVFTYQGQDQIVMPGAHCVYCYNPETGVELWRVTYNGFSNVPRPVFAHGLLYLTTGFANHEMLAIRPDGKGDVSKTHVVWRYRKNVPNVPSPIVVGDHLFMVSDKGIATCLDAKTGDPKWTERLAGSYTASLLAKDNTIYAFGDDGGTILFEAAGVFKKLGSNQLSGRIQATPAAAEECLFIRTEDSLYRIEESKTPGKR